MKNVKKILIYYFSGTGLTEYVINQLFNEFKSRGASVDCFKIEKNGSGPVSGYDLIGVAYPVHSFNAPKIVIDFAGQLPASNGTDTFIIHTAGEDNKINYASSNLLIRKLKRKGYKVFYNRLIEMPSNFIVKYEDAKVRGIIDQANKVLPGIAREIIELKPYSMEAGPGAKIISFLGRAEWPGAGFMGKCFYAKCGCTRCGKCADDCPNKNILMTGKGIRFKWHCGLCMRCVYRCPEEAIDVRQPFKFIRFDKWYDPELFKE